MALFFVNMYTFVNRDVEGNIIIVIVILPKTLAKKYSCEPDFSTTFSSKNLIHKFRYIKDYDLNFYL